MNNRSLFLKCMLFEHVGLVISEGGGAELFCYDWVTLALGGGRGMSTYTDRIWSDSRVFGNWAIMAYNLFDFINDNTLCIWPAQ